MTCNLIIFLFLIGKILLSLADWYLKDELVLDYFNRHYQSPPGICAIIINNSQGCYVNPPPAGALLITFYYKEEVKNIILATVL